MPIVLSLLNIGFLADWSRYYIHKTGTFLFIIIDEKADSWSRAVPLPLHSLEPFRRWLSAFIAAIYRFNKAQYSDLILRSIDTETRSL